MDWFATTNATLTFTGAPINPLRLSQRDSQETVVTYCNKRAQNVCGGTCQVYTGGPICLDAPGVACLAATRNVGFCTKLGCGGTCNQLASCGTLLDGGFCPTPKANSIVVEVDTDDSD